MTELLDRAMETARRLPPERQDDVARLMIAVAGEEGSLYELSPEELADLDSSDGEVARGELASVERMRAIWAKHDT